MGAVIDDPTRHDTALARAFLFERLSWPIAMARWRAARAIRDLLESDATRQVTTSDYLAFLARRQFETETAGLLNLLLLTKPQARPDANVVARILTRPSILSSRLLADLGATDRREDWRQGHSGKAPTTYQATDYFEKFKKVHVPPILSTHLARLEGATGLPFQRQWAFEWQQLQEGLSVPFSEHPRFFDHGAGISENIRGQYTQRQSELYRSAYLRTFAFAVDAWHLPTDDAEHFTLESLNGLGGLFNLDPGPPPTGVADLTEHCTRRVGSWAQAVTDYLRETMGGGQMLLHLHAPLALPQEFGDLRIDAFFVTKEFRPDAENSLEHAHQLLDRRQSLTINGGYEPQQRLSPEQFGRRGVALPTTAATIPLPFGLWQSDFHSAGLMLPLREWLPHGARLRCNSTTLDVEVAAKRVASTSFWLDHWTHNYMDDGTTRCGVILRADKKLLITKAKELGLDVLLAARLRRQVRRKSYEPFRYRTLRTHLRLEDKA